VEYFAGQPGRDYDKGIVGILSDRRSQLADRFCSEMLGHRATVPWWNPTFALDVAPGDPRGDRHGLFEILSARTRLTCRIVMQDRLIKNTILDPATLEPSHPER